MRSPHREIEPLAQEIAVMDPAPAGLHGAGMLGPGAAAYVS